MQKKQLSVTLIQSDLHWENITANLAMFEEKIWTIKEQTDLIVLPEMFTTGFSMNPEKFAEPMNLHTFKWLAQQAALTSAVVVGSYMVKDKGLYFNRLVWMRPDGTYSTYDKRHLFRMADEHLHYTAGNKILIEEIKGWKICPLICYDLRFPVWARNSKDLKYDLLLYIANWPSPRVNAWNVLLKARAIENWAYCVGVNRTGEDGTGKHYTGDSAILNYKGETLFHEHENEIIHTQVLDYEELDHYRTKFPVYMDSDDFEIKEV